MKFLKVFVVILISLMAPSAFAGAGGHGGGGFACIKGSILETHLLDLWEARKLRNLPIDFSQEPVNTQIKRAINKLKPIDSDFYGRVSDSLKYILSHKADLDPEISISPPADAQNTYFMTDCPLVGIMNYDDEKGMLEITKKYFDVLATNTDVAAAYVHEAIFKVIREAMLFHVQEPGQAFEVISSKGTRKLVGCLFSSTACFKMPPVDADLPTQVPLFQCEAPRLGAEFWYSQVSGDFSTAYNNIQVSVLNGFSVSSKTLAGGYILRNELFDLSGYSSGGIEVGDGITGLGYGEPATGSPIPKSTLSDCYKNPDANRFSPPNVGIGDRCFVRVNTFSSKDWKPYWDYGTCRRLK